MMANVPFGKIHVEVMHGDSNAAILPQYSCAEDHAVGAIPCCKAAMLQDQV